MLKKILIIGLLLFLAGITSFDWISARERKERQSAAVYKSKHDFEVDTYINKYTQWLRLPPGERSTSSWAPERWFKDKSEAQLHQEQQERLEASLDELATGQTDVYPFAHILYGDNWQEELQRYEKRKEWQEALFVCSFLCMSSGGAIIICCLSVWSIQYLRKVLAESKKSLEEKVETEDKQQTESVDGKKKLKRPARKNKKQVKNEKLSAILDNSGWYNLDMSLQAQKEYAQLKMDNPESNRWDNPTEEQIDDSTEGSAPVHSTLKAIADQIGAIRDYASKQQDRVQKLEDGYDWNIIKKFCLRVIRCVDNIEKRIDKLSKENKDTKHLLEIKDELVFALDSNGVEKFEPEKYSDYRGQERIAEVIKEREICDDESLAGKIAEVIRAGYQHVIDEGNIRVIRPAQVKLFAKKE